jgi:hypothetical protein
MPVEVIRLLVEAWPDGVKKKSWGETPLYSGMVRKASVEVIRVLVEAWPDGAKEKDKHGNTPLRYGMMHNAPVEVIRLLVKAWPAGLEEKDVQGKTPLDYRVCEGIPKAALEAHRHGMSASKLFKSFLLEGASLNVLEFARWFRENHYELVKRKDTDTIPLTNAMEKKVWSVVPMLVRCFFSNRISPLRMLSDPTSALA